MSFLTGHATVRELLERELPPVTLLRGAASVGKLTMARHLGQFHTVAAADTYEHVTSMLTIDSVRAILRFVSTAPSTPAGKLVIIRVDRASHAGMQALLKVLEEPPATARFILLATGRINATVQSRCTVMQLGLLEPADLLPILERMYPHTPGLPTLIANGDGTVQGTVNAPADKPKTTALAVLRAVATHDAELFDRSFKDFDEQAAQWLARWLAEAMSGRFKYFTVADMYGLHESSTFTAELCVALARNDRARARLAVRPALQRLLRLA